MVCTTPKKSPRYSFSLQPFQVQFLHLSQRDVIHSVARFRLRVHTLRFNRNMNPQVLPYL